MANHPLIEQNNFHALRRLLAHFYPQDTTHTPVNFLADNTTITSIPSGRLSFTYTATQGDKTVFIKISKPGFVANNIPASILATEHLHARSSLPTIKTYAGKDGRLDYRIPSYLGNTVNPELLGLLQGQHLTVSQGVTIDEISEYLPSLGSAMHTLMTEIGALVAKNTLNLSPLRNDQAFLSQVTADPFGFAALRQMFQDNFLLTNEQTYLKNPKIEAEVQRHIDALIPNLNTTFPASKGFAHNLKNGGLIQVLHYFNQLDHTIHTSLKAHPAPNQVIHNEIKPSNIGARLNRHTNEWTITQFFDFDQIAFGTEKNHDATPIEKDLGRSISFLSFDATTGAFYPENALNILKGFIERQNKPLSPPVVRRLTDYIRLGILTSYPVRSSYLAEELQGRPNAIALKRLDPSIHMQQLANFDQWVEKNNLPSLIRDLENNPVTQAHQRIASIEHAIVNRVFPAHIAQAFGHFIDASHHVLNQRTDAKTHYHTSKDNLYATLKNFPFLAQQLEKDIQTVEQLLSSGKPHQHQASLGHAAL